MRKINVLFAPNNIASIANITMHALNKIKDINAKGISYGKHKYCTFGPNWNIHAPFIAIKKNPFKRLYQEIKYKYFLFKLIRWADIIIWSWDIDKYSSFLIQLFKKKVFVEWMGSDIRVPEIVFRDNPYYKQIWENGEYDYTIESEERSKKIQNKFKSIHATPLLCIEMALFLDKKIFDTYIPTYQPINLEDFEINYPSKLNKKPIVVHTPSKIGIKGTKYVRQAVENLKRKKIDFEYIEIHNSNREESLNAINNCDIFIDQFIIGSYGMATCEALAMGKPVLCYLMPSLANLLPTDCPIFNTSLDTLEEMLEKCLLDAELRHETGKKSRNYAEKYHDADKIALHLKKLFINELNIV